jgi:ABC-type Mn2+/Zn2+ transport system permease subunit
MTAILVGLALGILLGLAYLFSKEPTVRRTLASSVLLGVVVGMLVELARRPLFTAIFAGLATIFVAEFIRWVMGSSRKKP